MPQTASTRHDARLYEAESRMSLADAARACGKTKQWIMAMRGETTIYDSAGTPIVSFWPVTGDGGVEARWHRREKIADDMDGDHGDITCDDGDPVDGAYFSRLLA